MLMARDMRFPCSTKPCRNHACLQKTFREGLVNGQRCRIFSVVIEAVFLIHLSFAFLAPQNMALRHPIAFDVYDPSASLSIPWGAARTAFTWHALFILRPKFGYDRHGVVDRGFLFLFSLSTTQATSFDTMCVFAPGSFAKISLGS